MNDGARGKRVLLIVQIVTIYHLFTERGAGGPRPFSRTAVSVLTLASKRDTSNGLGSATVSSSDRTRSIDVLTRA